MKKNWITKVAVLMLALVMVTSCFVGGTFAKYVTRAEGMDNARVAKWGVLIEVSGNAFATKYKAEDPDYREDGGEYSVVAAGENPDQVVAPGTDSDQVGQTLKAKVTGTPEVATRFTLKGEAVTDVVLPAGTYTDYTHLVKADDGTYGYTDTFTIDNGKNYSPVKWNLLIKKGTTVYDVAPMLYDALKTISPENLTKAEALGFTREGCSIFAAIAILQKVAGNEGYQNIVEAALSQAVSGGRNFKLTANNGEFEMSYDFDPNKELGFEFELSWEWAFENGEEILDADGNGTGIYEFDPHDTYLGNVAAGVVENVPAGVSTTIAATLTATATQID